MPDEPSTPDTPDTPVEAPDGSAGASDPTPEPETPENPQDRRDGRVRAERDQLRTERDALSTRVAAMQRAEIHRRAADHLASPADLDLVVSAEDYASCFDESGEIDEGTVKALMDKVTTERPTWRKRPTPRSGMDMGKRDTADVRPEPSWDSAFNR